MKSRTKYVLELCGSYVAFTAQLLQRPQRFTSETSFPPYPVAVLRLPVSNLALGRDEQLRKRLWADCAFFPHTLTLSNGTVTVTVSSKSRCVSPLVGVFCIQLPLQRTLL